MYKLLLLDCNVTIKGYQGAIEIDNQENLKTDKCAWTIVAPKGSSINITFTSLQIQKYKNRFRMFLSNYMNYTKNQLPANQCNNSQLTVSILSKFLYKNKIINYFLLFMY